MNKKQYDLSTILSKETYRDVKNYISKNLPNGEENADFGVDGMALVGLKNYQSVGLTKVVQMLQTLADPKYINLRADWGDTAGQDNSVVETVYSYADGKHNSFALKKHGTNLSYLEIPVQQNRMSGKKGLAKLPLQGGWAQIKENLQSALNIQIQENANLEIAYDKFLAKNSEQITLVEGKSQKHGIARRLLSPAIFIKNKLKGKSASYLDNKSLRVDNIGGLCLVSKVFKDQELSDSEKFLAIVDVFNHESMKRFAKNDAVTKKILAPFSEEDKKRILYAGQITANLFVSLATNLGAENHREIENAIKLELAGVLGGMEDRSYRATQSYGAISKRLTDAMLQQLKLSRKNIIANRLAMGVSYVDAFPVAENGQTVYTLQQIMFGRTINNAFVLENNKANYIGTSQVFASFQPFAKDFIEPTLETPEVETEPIEPELIEPELIEPEPVEPESIEPEPVEPEPVITKPQLADDQILELFKLNDKTLETITKRANSKMPYNPLSDEEIGDLFELNESTMDLLSDKSEIDEFFDQGEQNPDRTPAISVGQDTPNPIVPPDELGAMMDDEEDLNDGNDFDEDVLTKRTFDAKKILMDLKIQKAIENAQKVVNAINNKSTTLDDNQPQNTEVSEKNVNAGLTEEETKALFDLLANKEHKLSLAGKDLSDIEVARLFALLKKTEKQEAVLTDEQIQTLIKFNEDYFVQKDMQTTFADFEDDLIAEAEKKEEEAKPKPAITSADIEDSTIGVPFAQTQTPKPVRPEDIISDDVQSSEEKDALEQESQKDETTEETTKTLEAEQTSENAPKSNLTTKKRTTKRSVTAYKTSTLPKPQKNESLLNFNFNGYPFNLPDYKHAYADVTGKKLEKVEEKFEKQTHFETPLQNVRKMAKDQQTIQVRVARSQKAADKRRRAELRAKKAEEKAKSFEKEN